MENMVDFFLNLHLIEFGMPSLMSAWWFELA